MKKIFSVLMASSLFLTMATKSEAFFFRRRPRETSIGVTIYRYDDNFMALVRQAIDRANGEVEGINVLMNDSQNDQSRQNDQIDVLLSRGVAALAINLVDPAAAQTVIEKVRRDETPIVFFNKEPSQEALHSYEHAYYVGTESKEAGIIQGELIAKHWKANPQWDLNGDGVLQYVILTGEPGHPDAEARTRYVIRRLNELGIKTENLHLDTAMWDTAMARDKAEAWLSGPNRDRIEVFICNNDGMALGASEALRAAGKTHIPVYGVDALAEVLVKIEAGEIQGTVLNDAVNQGQATFDLANNLANGRSATEGTEWILENKAVRVPYVGVDISNLKDFK